MIFWIAMIVIVVAWFAYDLAKKIWVKECGRTKECCLNRKEKIEI